MTQKQFNELLSALGQICGVLDCINMKLDRLTAQGESKKKEG